MWLQILCCSPPYLWATFAGAAETQTKRSTFFFRHGCDSNCMRENTWNSMWFFNVCCWKTSRSASTKLLRRGLEVVDFWWKTKPFPRGKNDLCPCSSLAPKPKKWGDAIGFCDGMSMPSFAGARITVSFLKSTDSANWEWNILGKCQFFWNIGWNMMRWHANACHAFCLVLQPRTNEHKSPNVTTHIKNDHKM